MTRQIAVLMTLALASAAFAASPRLGRYALVLEEPPVARQIASRAELNSPAAKAAAARIQTRQAQVIAELKQRGVAVTGATHTLINAVFVQGDPGDASKFRGLGGVGRSVYLPPMHRSLDAASTLIKVPQAWAAISGGMQSAGAGVKIGIVDTGIDQAHPAFQQACSGGPSQPICSGDDCKYTNGKVIAARSYVRFMAAGWTLQPEETSRPDDLSPRDRDGHGTALAMIAAGNTVQAPGGTLTGVAPQACLGNYKVFGSPGVNAWASADAVIQALTDAYQDGMDIVSLSFGDTALYGPLDRGQVCSVGAGQYCDPRVELIETASQGANGMTVVIAAGNAGDLAADSIGYGAEALNSVDAPGTAPSAITVGASTNSHAWRESVRVTGTDVPGSLQNIAARFADAVRPGGPMPEWPLRDAAAVGDPKGCSTFPADAFRDMIAVIERGDCYFFVKANNAASAGARGVILYNDRDEDLFSPTGLENTGIPTVLISRADGVALKSYIAAHADAKAILDPTLQSYPVSGEDRVAALSSRGPSIGEFGIKPEVVAPGTDIYSAAQNYDPNGLGYDASRYLAASGTSFAAPQVAGVAALVKQKNRTWGPAQIKSAIVNTAQPLPAEDNALSVLQQGAGRLDAERAVKTTVTVSPATISFGVITASTFTDTAKNTRSLTVYAPSGVALTARVEQQIAASAVVSVENAPGQLTVRISGQVPQPGVYHGAVVLSGGPSEIRVPYVYFVSDGVPHSLVPLIGDGFDWTVNGTLWECPNWGIPSLALKAVDRFGVPVDTPDGTLTWSALDGGQIGGYDPGTALYGIGGACVGLGPNPGEQGFRASLNYMNQSLTYDFLGTARIRPAINVQGVVDAASNTVDPQRGLAPGSYAAIYGVGLSDTFRLFSTPYLPLALSNVSVSFDVPSQSLSVPGRLHFISPNQVNVQIPWELEGLNQVFMKVSVSPDIASTVYTLRLASAAPQLYQHPLGSGWAVAQKPNSAELYTQANPAPKGELVTLYANGLGAVASRPQTGEPTPAGVSPTTVPVTVTIGGKDAPVDYAGLSPQSIGLYQINVRIPADIPSGAQPIVVNMNGVVSNQLNIAVR